MIPAIGEDGQFVTATLRNGEKATVYALDVDPGLHINGKIDWHTAWDFHGRYTTDRESKFDIIDLPAVRTRVDAARVKRERDALELATRRASSDNVASPFTPQRLRQSFAEALEQVADKIGRREFLLSDEDLASAAVVRFMVHEARRLSEGGT